MAAKFGIPICPHGGGIGLCNMIIHYALWDQISVAGIKSNQYVEYLDFLQSGVFDFPIQVNNGKYLLPKSNGWGLDINQDFLKKHLYPSGEIWKGNEFYGSILFTDN